MANVHSGMAGMRRPDLPQTLQDSITVAEKLGIKHIWIDSLCIIQDSDDDWAIEASKMGEIYLESIVTIVAASSNSAEHGCFNQRSISTMQSLRAQNELISVQASFRDGRTSNLHIITRLIPEIEIGNGFGQVIEDLYRHKVKWGPWIKRAWKLQEQIFSRRILFYTDRMLLWECGHCRLSEDRHPQMQGESLYPLDILGSDASRGLNAALCNLVGGIESHRGTLLTVDTWYLGLVEHFTRRQMTFNSDKLNAIGALAKATSWGRRITYLAGLWGDGFRYGLMWLRDGPGSKITTSTCPSWSWVSQSSAVSYKFLTDIGNGSSVAQVLDVHVQPADKKNPFGDVQSRYVMLQTKVKTARVLPDFLGRTSSLYSDQPADTRGLFIGSGTVMSQWPLRAHMDDEDVRYDEALIAVVGTSSRKHIALLLHPPRVGAEEYRRVGIAILRFGSAWDDESEEISKGPLDSYIVQWPTKIIKIV